jgi:hypothetical protein
MSLDNRAFEDERGRHAFSEIHRGTETDRHKETLSEQRAAAPVFPFLIA